MDASLFYQLLIKLLPLYLIIFLGYVAARVLKLGHDAISRLLLYVIAPGVVFSGLYKMDFRVQLLLLPGIFFVLSAGISFLFFYVGKAIWKDDATKNILALAAGTGNTGYFGLPVVFAFFGEQALGLAVFVQIGMTLYEMTLGFYITARGAYSISESMRRVARLPILYAFLLGLLFNLLSIDLGEIADSMAVYFRSGYTLLGMMIIGMGIANVRVSSIDLRFIGLALLARSIVWPVMIALIIVLDIHVLMMFSSLIHKVMAVMAVVPLAANLVVFASELQVYPDKAAMAVTISTALALLYIPLLLPLVLSILRGFVL